MKGIIITILLTTLSIAGMCQPSNNPIFTGGNGDGWANNNYRQQANNIYNGGNGDGWANNNYRQQANNIYNGGSGDGWANNNYRQPANNIYNGGYGDGWSAYVPEILPVSFLLFNAAKKNEGAVLITWRTSREINSSYYEVQRSNDAMVYTNIGRVDAAGTAGAARDYNFTDQEPMKGMNYYRLRQVDLDGSFVYTPVKLVRFEEKNNEFVKYYPNPTAGMLNIQVTGHMKAEAKVINVSNAAGEMIGQLRTGPTNSGIIQVDLSRYTNGIYFLQIKTATTNSVQRIVLQRSL